MLSRRSIPRLATRQKQMMDRRIDMDALIFAWDDESEDNAYYLDTETGNVELVQQGLIDLDDLTDEIERNRERYLYIPKPDHKELREDLEQFVATVFDPELVHLLPVVMEAPNVMPAFKTVLSRNQPEWKRWERFRSERVQERIEKWLAANFVFMAGQPSAYDDRED